MNDSSDVYWLDGGGDNVDSQGLHTVLVAVLVDHGNPVCPPCAHHRPKAKIGCAITSSSKRMFFLTELTIFWYQWKMMGKGKFYMVLGKKESRKLRLSLTEYMFHDILHIMLIFILF